MGPIDFHSSFSVPCKSVGPINCWILQNIFCVQQKKWSNIKNPSHSHDHTNYKPPNNWPNSISSPWTKSSPNQDFCNCMPT